jgi:hypothetical protein
VQDHLLPHHDGGGIVRGSTGNVGLPVNNKLDDDDPNNLAVSNATTLSISDVIVLHPILRGLVFNTKPG